MNNDSLDSGLTILTADIVSAFVSHNRADASDIVGLISSTHAALRQAIEGPADLVAKPTPPVSIKKSITPEALISLEDGKRYKSLTRHLSTRGMTPADYRAKWSLPADYPMVAPDYAKRRSELAKASGLGRKVVLAGDTSSASDSVPMPTKRKSTTKTAPERVQAGSNGS